MLDTPAPQADPQAEGPAIGRWAQGLLRNIPLLVALGLVAGFLIFYYPLGGVPKVAVLDGPVDEIDGTVARETALKLEAVRKDSDVKAVVIRIDSPGGSAYASEDLFTNVLHVREKKPVVAFVDGLAASGAYFTAAGADHVVAKGTSIVGNVGAILVLPGRQRPSERIVGTGPFKLTGGSERTYLQILELVKDGFAAAVISQRGDRLKLSRDQLLEGRVYLGIEAVQLGLVDSLGTEVDAIKKAAALARLRRYEVMRVERGQSGKYRLASSRDAAKEETTRTSRGLAALKPEFPYVYYLFIPP